MTFDLPRRRRRAIGLAPLIDVVFILLLFFILTTNFTRWREMPIAMPAQAEALNLPEVRVLRLAADGLLRYGDRAFNDDDAAALRAFVAEAPDAGYVIDASGVSTQRLVDWLDRLKAAGATRLSLHDEAP